MAHVPDQEPSSPLAALPPSLAIRRASVIYALETLAWDLFYPLAMLCAAPVFRGNRLSGPCGRAWS